MADHWLTRADDVVVGDPMLPRALRQFLGRAVRQALREATDRGQGELDADKLVSTVLRLAVLPAAHPDPATMQVEVEATARVAADGRRFRLTYIIRCMLQSAQVCGKPVRAYLGAEHYGVGRWEAARSAAKVWRHRHPDAPVTIEVMSSIRCIKVTVQPPSQEKPA